MPEAIKNVLAPGDGSKPIWRRSSIPMAGILIALHQVAPETPWWGYAILAAVVALAQQKASPSVARKDLPR